MIYNQSIETAPRIHLEELQLERLKQTVAYVSNNVPFYTEKLAERHVTADDIQTLEDVQKLPFTKKQDLRDHYPFGLFAKASEDLVRIHGSSGTSGKPTVVGYSKKDIETWSEIVARALTAAGARPNDVFHNTFGYGLFTGGLGIHYGAEKLGMATVPVSGGNTDRQITLIEDFKPRGISGTPSYILNIAERMMELGKDPRETSLEYGIFGAEPWTEEMRQKLEETFDIKAVDIYGLSEVIGPGVAIECHEAQDGLHIADDHFLVEVIDPETLLPVPDGQTGELVFTSLTKEAFPILRYRTGDLASITREPCVCGRTTTRMSRIKGRIDDMIIIRGVNVFPSEIERTLLQVEEILPHYQIHLIKKGNMDAIQLHVEIVPEFSHHLDEIEDGATIMKLKRRIQGLLRSNCLVSMDIEIHKPKSIPRSEGKAVRIQDKRKIISQ